MTHSEWLEEVQYELGAELGDPRRCPRHPHVKTSSNDGMHDAPCGACEAEMDLDDDTNNNDGRMQR
jgi:hypothetical protein